MDKLKIIEKELLQNNSNYSNFVKEDLNRLIFANRWIKRLDFERLNERIKRLDESYNIYLNSTSLEIKENPTIKLLRERIDKNKKEFDDYFKVYINKICDDKYQKKEDVFLIIDKFERVIESYNAYKNYMTIITIESDEFIPEPEEEEFENIEKEKKERPEREEGDIIKTRELIIKRIKENKGRYRNFKRRQFIALMLGYLRDYNIKKVSDLMDYEEFIRISNEE